MKNRFHSNGDMKPQLPQFTPMKFRDLKPGDQFYLIRHLMISPNVDLMTKTHDTLYSDPKGECHAIWSLDAHVYGPVLRATKEDKNG